jgi:hypothetical protein
MSSSVRARSGFVTVSPSACRGPVRSRFRKSADEALKSDSLRGPRPADPAQTLVAAVGPGDAGGVGARWVTRSNGAPLHGGRYCGARRASQAGHRGALHLAWCASLLPYTLCTSRLLYTRQRCCDSLGGANMCAPLCCGFVREIAL